MVLFYIALIVFVWTAVSLLWFTYEMAIHPRHNKGHWYEWVIGAPLLLIAVIYWIIRAVFRFLSPP